MAQVINTTNTWVRLHPGAPQGPVQYEDGFQLGTADRHTKRRNRTGEGTMWVENQGIRFGSLVTFHLTIRPRAGPLQLLGLGFLVWKRLSKAGVLSTPCFNAPPRPLHILVSPGVPLSGRILYPYVQHKGLSFLLSLFRLNFFQIVLFINTHLLIR